MGITENAAYLKGLFDGYELNKDAKETKIIAGLLELVSDMADEIAALEKDNKELHEYVDELDYDLGALEEDYYDTCDGDCENCDVADECENYSDLNDDEEFESDEDGEYYEIECPHCGETICFDDSIEISDLCCPACGEAVDSVEPGEE